MKKRKFVALVFGCIFCLAVGAYFVTHLVLGAKNIKIDTNDIGKIKYVDKNGNSIFAGTGAIVFNMPVEVGSVKIENDIAKITVRDYCIVRAPAHGVVIFAEGGKVVIDHGNNTSTQIEGLDTLGVQQNEEVFAGKPLGATTKEIEFSVRVDDIPVGMKWILNEVENAEQN